MTNETPIMIRCLMRKRRNFAFAMSLYWEELRHLAWLERKLVLAVGPPVRVERYKKKSRQVRRLGRAGRFRRMSAA